MRAFLFSSLAYKHWTWHHFGFVFVATYAKVVHILCLCSDSFLSKMYLIKTIAVRELCVAKFFLSFFEWCCDHTKNKAQWWRVDDLSLFCLFCFSSWKKLKERVHEFMKEIESCNRTIKTHHQNIQRHKATCFEQRWKETRMKNK